MASSFYYLALYQQEAELEQKLRRWIDELRPIYNHFCSDFNGNIDGLNRTLDSLQEGLLSGVQDADIYANNVNNLDEENEPGISSDRYLSQTDSDLQEELNDLETKRQTAERNRDSYYQSYLAAKAREEEEARRAREAAEAAAKQAEAQAKAAAKVAGH